MDALYILGSTLRLRYSSQYEMRGQSDQPGSQGGGNSGAIIAGPHQLDSGVGTGFWLYRVCMYVYENSGRMFGRGILAGGSLRDFDGVHLEYRKIF
jgi:hypothetical protein